MNNKKIIFLFIGVFLISFSFSVIYFSDKKGIENNGVGIIYLSSLESSEIHKIDTENNIIVVPGELFIKGETKNLEYFPALKGELSFLKKIN